MTKLAKCVRVVEQQSLSMLNRFRGVLYVQVFLMIRQLAEIHRKRACIWVALESADTPLNN